MEIDNKTARGLPLFFEIEPQHLIDCTNPRRQLHRMPTTLTVRRSFTIRNNGEVGKTKQRQNSNKSSFVRLDSASLTFPSVDWHVKIVDIKCSIVINSGWRSPSFTNNFKILYQLRLEPNETTFLDIASVVPHWILYLIWMPCLF